MSGPKSYRYQVDERALQAQREAARLGAEEVRLTAALAQLQREWLQANEQYGATVGATPALGAPGATQDGQAAFARRLAGERAILTERIRAQQQASMLAAIAAAIGDDDEIAAAIDGEAALARALARVQGEPGQGRTGLTPLELAGAVARNVARLPVEATATERARVESAAETVLQRAAEPYAESRLDGLRAAVAQVERAVAERAVRERAVQSALARLDALDAAATASVRAGVEVARGGRGALPADIEAHVADAEATATRGEERAYVTEVLARSLTELGYEVGPSFEAKLGTKGFADVAVPSWAGYDVRVRSSPAGGRLTFNVVRGEGDIDPRRDSEVETKWCGALPDIVHQLARAGIDVERVAAVPAGAQPVQVDPSLPAIPARTATRTTSARQRPLDGR